MEKELETILSLHSNPYDPIFILKKILYNTTIHEPDKEYIKRESKKIASKNYMRRKRSSLNV